MTAKNEKSCQDIKSVKYKKESENKKPVQV
jgi:hypothetical protein